MMEQLASIRSLFVRTNEDIRRQEQTAFSNELCSLVNQASFDQLEAEIAAWYFRRPVLVPILSDLFGIGIRPFWRDSKIAPPLKIDLSKSGYRLYYD
ncbi:hypothetical protein M1563_03550 [Patescibacteria group bacterium]|nr:hypothetical protein [Patescibacteria group bacterium]MCL5410010.1 hypothetical protein [Patescibacteria group bacterium]